MKKLICILLAAVMMFSLCVSAFAQSDTDTSVESIQFSSYKQGERIYVTTFFEATEYLTVTPEEASETAGITVSVDNEKAITAAYNEESQMVDIAAHMPGKAVITVSAENGAEFSCVFIVMPPVTAGIFNFIIWWFYIAKVLCHSLFLHQTI